MPSSVSPRSPPNAALLDDTLGRAEFGLLWVDNQARIRHTSPGFLAWSVSAQTLLGWLNQPVARLLPACDGLSAMHVGEKLLAVLAVLSSGVEMGDMANLMLGASIGVSVFPTDGRDWSSW